MMLARKPGEIQIGKVFREIEGTFPIVECFADTDNTCPLVSACRLRLALADAAEAFFAHLDEITLESLVCNNVDLLKLLQPVSCLR
jgi:Rrf2 family nitric oxide-sensitive transcriptional repressor